MKSINITGCKNIVKGTHVLDFACGSGENGIFAAQCGAEVTGDISPEGVENANQNAALLKFQIHAVFSKWMGVYEF